MASFASPHEMASPSSREALGVLVPSDLPPEEAMAADDVSPVCLFTRFFPGQDGKCFGRPAWLGTEIPTVIAESLVCQNCPNQIPLVFLGQVNTSNSFDEMYRFIYLFMCMNCNKDFRAVRGYLSHQNPLYYPTCLDASRWGQGVARRNAEIYDLLDGPAPENVMEISVDDLAETARFQMLRDSELGFCRICLVPTGFKCPMQKIERDDEFLGLYSGDVVHARCLRRAQLLKDIPHCRGSYNGIPIGTQIEEMELIGRTRDLDISCPKLGNLGIDEEKALLDEKNQAMTAEQAKELDEAIGDDDEADIQEAYGEELRMKDADGLVPVIRYDPGSPLIYWMNGLGALRPSSQPESGAATGWSAVLPATESSDESVMSVPDCPRCGGARKFEFQMYSSVCTYAKKELDIGTLAVFACVNDCSKNMGSSSDYVQGYSSEVVHVQFDDTTVKDKIFPIMYC